MNALRGFIGSKEREQTVWTPEFILDAVDKVFPDGWADRFPSEGSPATLRASPKVIVPCADALETTPWPDRCFANPPYKELKLHLPRAAYEWGQFDVQTVLLIPIRTLRVWWCGAVRGATVAYLKSLAFIDSRTGAPYPGAFPENLAAVYWGDRRATFMDAFADLSTHMQEHF